MRIYYKNAICGAGKTYGAIEYAIERAYKQDARIAIIQPSRDLIDQTYNDIINKGLETNRQIIPTKIYSRAGQNQSVTKQVIDYLLNVSSMDCGQILLITHASFIDIEPWFGKETWELIIDEIPNVTPSYSHYLEKSSGYFKRITALGQSVGNAINSKYVELKVNDRKLASDCVHTIHDELNVYRKLCQSLLSIHTDIFVIRDQWDNIGTKDINFIECYGITKPSLIEGFSKVTIMGAHFTDSMLYQIWSGFGISFIENTDISVRYTKHNIKNRTLNIHYISERDWSKQIRKEIGCTDDNISPIIPAISSVLKCDPFIWFANNDILSKAVDTTFPNGKRISNISHGINSYAGIHNVLGLAALNPTPGHFKILETHYGVDPIELKRANSHQTIYQAVMRCSLRDPNATNEVNVIVPDRSLAEWFASQFINNNRISVKVLPTGISALTLKVNKGGRPPLKDVAMSAKDRKELYIQKKKQLLDSLASLLWDLNYQDIQMKTGEKNGTKLYYNNKTFVPEKSTVSLIQSIYDAPVFYEYTNQEHFINQLYECWKYKSDSKKDNILISPAKFISTNTTDTTRGLDNVEQVNGIWFDQDNGYLTPDDMARIFKGIRFIAMNTYSGNKRYYFPTQTPMTKEVYHAMWDIIVSAIEADGFSRDENNPKYHGIDRSKRPASSLFYIPCQAKNPNQSFWTDIKGEYINPIDWLDYVIPDKTEYVQKIPHQNPMSKDLSRLINKLRQQTTTLEVDYIEKQKDKALTRWRTAPPKHGNHEFFVLAMTLKGLGLDKSEIQNILITEASNGKSARERKAQIPSIMKSIKNK